MSYNAVGDTYQSRYKCGKHYVIQRKVINPDGREVSRAEKHRCRRPIGHDGNCSLDMSEHAFMKVPPAEKKSK